MLKPKVLVACPPYAFPALERVLGSYANLVFTNRLDSAKAVLDSTPELAMVVCGIHFDESRMFDLLRYARDRYAGVPFCCVRMLDDEARRIDLEGAVLAAHALGAVEFADYVTAIVQHGREGADHRLQDALLRHVIPGKFQPARG